MVRVASVGACGATAAAADADGVGRVYGELIITSEAAAAQVGPRALRRRRVNLVGETLPIHTHPLPLRRLRRLVLLVVGRRLLRAARQASRQRPSPTTLRNCNSDAAARGSDGAS